MAGGKSEVTDMYVNELGLLVGPCPILSLDWGEKIGITEIEQRIFCGQGCSVICPDEFLKTFRKRCSAAGIGNVQTDLFRR